MYSYILDTKYAVCGLVTLITEEENYLAQIQREHKKSKEKENSLRQRFEESHLNASLIEEQAKYIAWYNSCKELTNLQKKVVSLEMSINTKSVSINALCGAVLQIAKQGISIKHSNPSSCPAGRIIGLENLRNVVLQGRNQSLHYEEGEFKSAVKNCFNNLEISFGSKFPLSLNSGENLAYYIIELLGWKDYSTYENDLSELLQDDS